MEDFSVVIGVFGAAASAALAAGTFRAWLQIKRLQIKKAVKPAALDPLVQQWISRVDESYRPLAREMANLFEGSIYPIERKERERLNHIIRETMNQQGQPATWPPDLDLGRTVPSSVMEIEERPVDSTAVSAFLRLAREELERRVESTMLQENRYRLTKRELAVLHLIVSGRSNKEIAWLLGISPHTARKHGANVATKMDASSLGEVAARAVREGLVK